MAPGLLYLPLNNNWLDYSMIICWLLITRKYDLNIVFTLAPRVLSQVLPHGPEDEDESYSTPLTDCTSGCQRGELQSPGWGLLERSSRSTISHRQTEHTSDASWWYAVLFLTAFPPLLLPASSWFLTSSISYDGFGHQIPTGLSIKA